MLIGLSAKKQCGKNTVCTIIKAIDLYYNCDSIHTKGTLKEFVLECLNDGRLGKIAAFRNIESLWQERSFACNLRRSLYAITGDNRVFAQDEKTKEEETTIKKPEGGYYTIRQLLQKFGTEVGRNISPDIWVDSLLGEYNKAKSGDLEEDWIITDVRFQNEANAVREAGGVLLRLNRDTGFKDTHQSEIDLDNYDKFDYIIDNNGTLEELIDKVLIFMSKFDLI